MCYGKKIPALALSKLNEIRNGEDKSSKLGDFKYKMTKKKLLVKKMARLSASS